MTIAMRYTRTGNDFDTVRFLYSITVGFYFMRFLQAFIVFETVGPKLIMFKKMVTDLFYFTAIFLVFYVSFSVMYQANMYPNSSERPFLWANFLYTPFWQIFGELFLENFIPESPYRNCDKNVTSADDRWRCPEDNNLVIFIAAIYVILTHIVLLNLLIAIFSHTFASIQEKSDHIWKYYWYGIVREHYNRTVVCPPLIILVHIYRALRYVVFRCGCFVYDSEFRLKDLSFKGLYSKQLLKFADAAAERYLQQNKNAETQEFEIIKLYRIIKSREGN
ncbi:hypothetical protein DPMN_117722 [Dreissena polymorpha]|uniref:Ion transport domain-containing protein n=1 Tax=Dreissena polymorpha TaxID=45954 RepID=A0A9D4GJJ5_DREPO|nr:hypothetical protein DPMN_117722 [Dreissena polymorpha]